MIPEEQRHGRRIRAKKPKRRKKEELPELRIRRYETKAAAELQEAIEDLNEVLEANAREMRGVR